MYRELRYAFSLRSQMAQSVMSTVIARYKSLLSNKHPWTRSFSRNPSTTWYGIGTIRSPNKSFPSTRCMVGLKYPTWRKVWILTLTDLGHTALQSWSTRRGNSSSIFQYPKKSPKSKQEPSIKSSVLISGSTLSPPVMIRRASVRSSTVDRSKISDRGISICENNCNKSAQPPPEGN